MPLTKRKDKNILRLAPSQVGNGNAGFGVFAKVEFKKDKIICEYEAEGMKSDIDNKNPFDDAIYTAQLTKRWFVSAEHSTHISRYINTIRDPHEKKLYGGVNCSLGFKIHNCDEPDEHIVVSVKCTRNIAVKKELFLAYGNAYKIPKL